MQRTIIYTGTLEEQLTLVEEKGNLVTPPQRLYTRADIEEIILQSAENCSCCDAKLTFKEREQHSAISHTKDSTGFKEEWSTYCEECYRDSQEKEWIKPELE